MTILSPTFVKKFSSMNNTKHKIINFFTKGWGFLFITAISLASCHSIQNTTQTDYTALAKASYRLGLDIDRKDNHRLMIEASKWIGVPHRYGGSTMNGVDCSGLTWNLYKSVYNINLSRSSQAQYDNDVRHSVSKRNLKQGDLVFFSTQGSRKKINHVGIYMKDGKFIHTSSSKGVRLDYLNDNYWKDKWISGGRIYR